MFKFIIMVYGVSLLVLAVLAVRDIFDDFPATRQWFLDRWAGWKAWWLN